MNFSFYLGYIRVTIYNLKLDSDSPRLYSKYMGRLTLDSFVQKMTVCSLIRWVKVNETYYSACVIL